MSYSILFLYRENHLLQNCYILVCLHGGPNEPGTDINKNKKYIVLFNNRQIWKGLVPKWAVLWFQVMPRHTRRYQSMLLTFPFDKLGLKLYICFYCSSKVLCVSFNYSFSNILHFFQSVNQFKFHFISSSSIFLLLPLPGSILHHKKRLLFCVCRVLVSLYSCILFKTKALNMFSIIFSIPSSGNVPCPRTSVQSRTGKCIRVFPQRCHFCTTSDGDKLGLFAS